MWEGSCSIAAGGGESTGGARRHVGTGRPGLGQHELPRLPLPGHAVIRDNEERRVPRTARG